MKRSNVVRVVIAALFGVFFAVHIMQTTNNLLWVIVGSLAISNGIMAVGAGMDWLGNRINARLSKQGSDEG